VLTLSISSASAENPSAICEQHLFTAAEAEGVPPGLLYAVALTESGNGGVLSPFAINVEGTTVASVSKAEAMQAYELARLEGKRLIDVGCMQVNVYFHRDGFNTLDEMFEPLANITYAAKFLKALHAKHGSWTQAVARYHAGPKNKPAQKRYVCKVLSHLVAMKFGAWTDESRALCG
jgi:soluble lytic murein transglycosylase-like protein